MNIWDKTKEETINGNVTRNIVKLYDSPKPIKLLIYNNLCPGDIIVMTAALDMLHKQYPGRFITDVKTHHNDIFLNNPNITKLDPKASDVHHFWTSYPLINKSSQTPVHFIEGYLDWFSKKLDIDLYMNANRPSLYMSEEEKKELNIPQMKGIKNYWVVNSGWKNDYTIKRWPAHYFQEVVNHFKDKITFVQIGLDKKGHNHPKLEGVVDLINKTSIRQLINLCYHSNAGLGTITCILHMYAAFRKPYVVTHGAREPVNFTFYQSNKILSNVGTLECCKLQACWRSRIVPLKDDDKKNKRCCVLPMTDDDERPVARCMWNIKPQQVIDAIEQYYAGGIFKYNGVI